MKAKLIDIDNNEVGEISLSTEIFAVEQKEYIVNQVINWQRAKSQAGTHQVKERGDVSGTTRKPHKQKGTGSARLGSKRAAQCRGGGIIFGPKTRSHAFSLPKKIRKFGLKIALSSKLRDGKLSFIDNLDLNKISTSEVNSKLSKNYNGSLLIIHCGNESNTNFIKSVSNIYKVDTLPQIGANVYDILNHDNLIITKEAVNLLEERLK